MCRGCSASGHMAPGTGGASPPGSGPRLLASPGGAGLCRSTSSPQLQPDSTGQGRRRHCYKEEEEDLLGSWIKKD